MKEFFNSKAGMRFNAILWTVTTAIWTVVCVLRADMLDQMDEPVFMMSLFAALASLAACIVNWVRYVNFEEKTETEEA